MSESGVIRMSTKRLELIAATEKHLCAELESPERMAAMLGARVSPEWPPGEYDRGAQEFFRQRMAEGGEAVTGWYVWYAVRRAEAGRPPALVGAGGYFGPPGQDGVVEIGFSVTRSERRMGYATEMVSALVERALTDGRVRTVRAHTTPENVAACRVLEKCGFRPVSRNVETGQARFETSAAAVPKHTP